MLACTLAICGGWMSFTHGQEPNQEAFHVTPIGQGNANPLEARLDDLELQNSRFAKQLGEFEAKNQSLRLQLKLLSDQRRSPSKVPGKLPQLDDVENTSIAPGSASDDPEQPSNIPTDDPESIQANETREPDKTATKSNFDQGFQWATEDGEFDLQFHHEAQLDIRAYGQSDSDPVNQFGFYIPRARMIFNGHLTKPIEYNVSINKGLGSLDLLDAYFNFNYDERLQMRIGRYRVPFTYDWFALSNQFLSTPERSVFASNYGFNRNFAAMMHGELMDEEIEYAVAAANGPRNSYFDTNAAKDVLTYVNFRPFRNSNEFTWLKHLNLGGSFDYGWQDQSPLPVAFRTSANATESAGTVEGVPAFLQLDENVTEKGERLQWELHAALYYKQLSLLGALDRGLNTYGFSDHAGSVPVHARAWHVQFGYFITGEEVERRTFVEPLRPFDLRSGKRGPGAIELQARFDRFELGDNVFDGGLADHASWTNQVTTIDSGINWYLNKYVKIDFDWQHCLYGSPVTFRPGGYSTPVISIGRGFRCISEHRGPLAPPLPRRTRGKSPE